MINSLPKHHLSNDLHVFTRIHHSIGRSLVANKKEKFGENHN